MAKSGSWLNPFWFPSETKVRFGLVLLAAGCLFLFAVRRGIEALGRHPLAWAWLVLVLFLPTVWRLVAQSMHFLRRRLTLTPVETASLALAEAVARLAHDRWLDLPSPPCIWFTPCDIPPVSLGLGRRKHVILPLILLEQYRPDERGMSAELDAVLRHELAHIKNGDLCLKGLADVAFRAARDSLLLWMLPLVLWSVLGSGVGPAVSPWEALYLALALVGSFYLYRTALRWRELYADARVTLGLGAGEPLAQGLTAVRVLLNLAWEVKRTTTSLTLPGLGLVATDVWQRIRGRRQLSVRWPARLQALFRSYPTETERKAALSDPNRLFQAADRGLILLSGFLPVLVVGLLFSLLSREPLNATLLAGLSHVWPRLSQLVAEGQEGLRALAGSVGPALGATISQTTLVDSLQAAIRLPLALWVLTQVLVGPVARGRGFSALKVSVWFVIGVLAAETTSLELLGLLLQPQGGGYVAILLGYVQALIGGLAFAVMVFFYVFALRGLLRRYPSPPQFRRWRCWTSALFIGVVAWESLGAVPLGSTVEMLPYIALPKVAKWLLILVAVAWLGLTTRRRCPVCNQLLMVKDEGDISSPHRCGRCDYPLYEGWTEARSSDVAGGQVAHWLSWASESAVNEVVAGLRRIGRQAGLRREAWGEVVAQVAPGWAERMRVYRPPRVGRVAIEWATDRVRGGWTALFPPQEMTKSALPLVATTLIQGIVSVFLLFGCGGVCILGAVVNFAAPDRLEESLYSAFYAVPESAVVRLIAISILLHVLFILTVLCFLTYLLLRGTWEGRPWAYAVNLALTGLLSATVVLSIIEVPFLLYLLRPETKRHFRIRSSSAIPLASYLLTTLYAMICLLSVFVVVQPVTRLPLLLDPAVYDAWRTLWDPAYASPDNLPLNRWIRAFIFDGFPPLIWVAATFALTRGAKRGQSWAYLIGIGLTAVAACTLLLLPLAVLFLRYLMKPEVRRFYGLGRLRPVAVDLVGSFFVFVSFIDLIGFIGWLTVSVGGILFPTVQIEGHGLSSILPALLAQGNWSILALLSCIFYFNLAWGNLHGRRWAYVLSLGGLLFQLLTGLVLIRIDLIGNWTLFASKWFEPSFWLIALYLVLSVVIPVPALIAMLRLQVQRYFGVTNERPLTVDLTTSLYVALGLVTLVLLSFLTIFAAANLIFGDFLSGEHSSSLTGEEVDFYAALTLLFLGLGDFLVIPNFILAAAVWRERAWAYRVTLRITTLATASFVLTPIALPLMIALARPVVQRLYLKEDKTTTHPLVGRLVFLHRLNLILWSVLASLYSFSGILSVSSPALAQNWELWVSGCTTYDIFWLGVQQLYYTTVLIGAIILTILAIRGTKKHRSWAYLVGLGLAAYELTMIHSLVELDILFVHLILGATGLSLLITMVLRPARQHFSGDTAGLPTGAVSWGVFLWLSLFQGFLFVLPAILGILIAQLSYGPGGESLDSATLLYNYIIYGAIVVSMLMISTFGTGVAKGLWLGQRWAYLFTLATLALSCLAIVSAVIALPLLIALWRPASRAHFGPRGRPLVVEVLSLAYAGAVLLCLLIAFGPVISAESREVTLLTSLEFTLFAPKIWRTTEVILAGGALAGALSCSLLAVAVWQGRPWAHRVTIGLSALGSLTVIGAPLGVPIVIALLRLETRRFFQPNGGMVCRTTRLAHLQTTGQASRDFKPNPCSSEVPQSGIFREAPMTARRWLVRCPKCQAQVLPNSRHCSYCGAALTDTSDEPAFQETRVEPVRTGPPLPPVTCPMCGKQNEPDEVKCWDCGINLAWALEHLTEPCHVCGTPNPRGAKHCRECGVDLSWGVGRDRERCRVCGADNPLNATNCQQCGVKLAWARQQGRPKSVISRIVDSVSDGDTQSGRNMLAIASLVLGLVALIGMITSILMSILGAVLEVSDESPLWVLVGIAALLSALFSLGGTISAIIALIRKRKQFTAIGRRNAIIGLASGSLLLMCWICMFTVGLLLSSS